MYLCMYKYVFIYVFIYLFIFMYICIYVFMYIAIHIILIYMCHRNILIGLFIILLLMCGTLILALFALNNDATILSWMFALLIIILVCHSITGVIH